MTLEQRLDHVEQQNERILQQNQRIERKNRRLTTALTLTVVAMCAGVTMAAIKLPTDEEIMFDELIARSGTFGSISALDIILHNASGKPLVKIDGQVGSIQIRDYDTNEVVVKIGSSGYGLNDETFGYIDTYSSSGAPQVHVGSTIEGQGRIETYGSDRKGKGRTLKPGP
jgi:hypothetical protein